MRIRTDREKAEDIMDIFAEYLENIGVFKRDCEPNREKFGATIYDAMVTEIINWM